MVNCDDLAQYSISFKIEGMKIPGKNPGIGDRELVFNICIDPEDIESANEAWYRHFELIFGDGDAVSKMQLLKVMANSELKAK